MKVAFVIGNGKSRANIDLKPLKNIGYNIGCNAIIRDWHPDNISCADRRMVAEVEESGYKGNLYTRDNFPKLPYWSLMKEDNPLHWNSGPHAINIACQQKPDLLFMLGFDLQPGNIYEDTQNYDVPNPDPKFWIHQLNRMFNTYPDTMFMWVVPQDVPNPASWDTNNLYRSTIKQFTDFTKRF